MNYNCLKISIPLILSIILLGCGTSEKGNLKDDESQPKPVALNEALSIQRTTLIGRHLDLEGLLGDSVKTNSQGLFLYTGFDCGSCVSVGFQVVHKMDSIKSNNKFVVLECQSNKGRDQVLYHYNDYIFSDTKDAVRRRLKYIKTPAILMFSSNHEIADVYYPESEDVIRDVVQRLVDGQKSTGKK